MDTRTPDELMEIIEAKGRELADALALLRGSLSRPDGNIAQADGASKWDRAITKA